MYRALSADYNLSVKDPRGIYVPSSVNSFVTRQETLGRKIYYYVIIYSPSQKYEVYIRK